MILVMPLGGTGERFKQAGYTEPKPLIMVGKHRLIELALRTYQDLEVWRVFYVRDTTLKAMTSWPTAHENEIIVPITAPTRGPIETLLQEPEHLDTDDSLLIADCDSWMEPEELQGALSIFKESHAAGGVTVKNSTDPNASYAAIGDGWWVTETRERDAFSPWSTTGPYWWAHGTDFLQAARWAQRQGLHTIAPCYNHLLQHGGRVKAVPVATFIHLGDPAALEAYSARVRKGEARGAARA